MFSQAPTAWNWDWQQCSPNATWWPWLPSYSLICYWSLVQMFNNRHHISRGWIPTMGPTASKWPRQIPDGCCCQALHQKTTHPSSSRFSQYPISLIMMAKQYTPSITVARETQVGTSMIGQQSPILPATIGTHGASSYGKHLDIHLSLTLSVHGTCCPSTHNA